MGFAAENPDGSGEISYKMIIFAQLWAFLIAFPGLYSLPSKTRSVWMWFVLSVTVQYSMMFTDSMGSSWCFFNVGHAIIFLADYLIYDCPGDELESVPYGYRESVKV